MNIVIRGTVESDLPELLQIQADPLVRPHQYKLSAQHTLEFWRHYLFGKHSLEPRALWTTILRDREIIGYIARVHYQRGGKRVVYCGWDLSPRHWGQGLMRIALSELFDSLFSVQQIDVVLSDCFAGNRRCIRLLRKLNFSRAGIGPLERLSIATSRRCLHWIRRFRLTAVEWQNRSNPPTR